MRLITVFMLVFVFLAGGCATGVKKHATQKSQQTSLQEPSDQSYSNEESWSPEVYSQPAKKVSSEKEEQLSIRQIQRALKKAGFYKGEIDGKAGPKTKEAIMKFQKAYGLKTDGVVGKRTSVELHKYL